MTVCLSLRLFVDIQEGDRGGVTSSDLSQVVPIIDALDDSRRVIMSHNIMIKI